MKTNQYLAKAAKPLSRGCFCLLFCLLAFCSCKPKIYHPPVYRIDYNSFSTILRPRDTSNVSSKDTSQLVDSIRLAPGDVIEMEFLQLYTRDSAPSARFAPIYYKVRIPLRAIPDSGNLKSYEKLFLISCLATLVNWDSTRINKISRSSLDAELFRVWKNLISTSYIKKDTSSRSLKITNSKLLTGTLFTPLKVNNTINNTWIIRPEFNGQFDQFFADKPDQGKKNDPLNTTYYNKSAPTPLTIIFSSVLKNGVRYSTEFSETEEGRWSLKDWADSRAVYLKKTGNDQIDTLTRARISSITLKKEYTPDGKELEVFIKDVATGTLQMRADGKILYTDPKNEGATKDVEVSPSSLSEVYPYMLESVTFTRNSPMTSEEKQSK